MSAALLIAALVTVWAPVVWAILLEQYENSPAGPDGPVKLGFKPGSRPTSLGYLTSANSDAPRVTPPATAGRRAADPGGEPSPAVGAEALAAFISSGVRSK